MKHFETMKKLLPRGKAFKEARGFFQLLKSISLEFDNIFELSTRVFKGFDETKDLWEALLETDQVEATLSAQGGQSKEYLISVLKKYSSQPEKIDIIPYRGGHKMNIIGVEMEITNTRSGMTINQPIRQWKRNERLIKGFETIKHAEVEARYYNQWTELYQKEL